MANVYEIENFVKTTLKPGLNIRCPNCTKYFDEDANTLDWFVINAIKEWENRTKDRKNQTNKGNKNGD